MRYKCPKPNDTRAKKKFAIFPTSIEPGVKIWLEHYWVVEKCCYTYDGIQWLMQDSFYTEEEAYAKLKAMCKQEIYET